jgi:hypothetical protein
MMNASEVKRILGPKFEEIYVQEFKFPKYNGKVTVLHGTDHGGKILARSGKWTKEEHLKIADVLGYIAVNVQDKYERTLDKASMETFGRKYQMTDYKISCIARDEYSEKRKDELRLLCKGITIYQTLASAHKDAAKLQGRYKFVHGNPPSASYRKSGMDYLPVIADGKKRETLFGSPLATVATAKKFAQIEINERAKKHIKKNPRPRTTATKIKWYKVTGGHEGIAYGLDANGTYKARYDFSIANNNDMVFVPQHGGIKMSAVTSLARAKKVLNDWFKSTQMKSNPRPRKYVTVIIGQGNYGSGWEDETSYLDDKDGRAEAKVDKKSYQENSQYPFRLIRRRVKIADYESGNF